MFPERMKSLSENVLRIEMIIKSCFSWDNHPLPSSLIKIFANVLEQSYDIIKHCGYKRMFTHVHKHSG